MDVFSIICRLLAGYFLYLALYAIGYPPSDEIGSTPLTLLLIGLFLFLLPKASKISLGKILTFEKEVTKVKEDVKEFKGETRELMNVYSNMITAISNTVNQTVNVNFPGVDEREKAQEDLNASLKPSSQNFNFNQEVDEYILSAGGDINFALAKLRMELEKELRVILGKRTQTSDPNQIRTFLSARQLFKKLTIEYPEYKQMHSSYDYILKACNAAIHGQKIPEGYGEEALYMGLKMLTEFRSLTNDLH